MNTEDLTPYEYGLLFLLVKGRTLRAAKDDLDPVKTWKTIIDKLRYNMPQVRTLLETQVVEQAAELQKIFGPPPAEPVKDAPDDVPGIGMFRMVARYQLKQMLPEVSDEVMRWLNRAVTAAADLGRGTAHMSDGPAEHFPHDVCPKCTTPSVPAEKVPDQALRGCPKCEHVWMEDLSQAPTVRLDVHLVAEMSDFIRRMAVNGLPGSSGAAREEAGKLFARILKSGPPVETPLAEFGRRTLEIMEDTEDWSSDTLDLIVDVAVLLKLATNDGSNFAMVNSTKPKLPEGGRAVIFKVEDVAEELTGHYDTETCHFVDDAVSSTGIWSPGKVTAWRYAEDKE